jgi:hypothetical protein
MPEINSGCGATNYQQCEAARRRIRCRAEEETTRLYEDIYAGKAVYVAMKLILDEPYL